MTDLINLVSSLVTPDGKILVKGVDEMVPEPDEDEKIYASLDYSITYVEQSVGAVIALLNDKVSVTQHPPRPSPNARKCRSIGDCTSWKGIRST